MTIFMLVISKSFPLAQITAESQTQVAIHLTSSTWMSHRHIKLNMSRNEHINFLFQPWLLSW